MTTRSWTSCWIRPTPTRIRRRAWTLYKKVQKTVMEQALVIPVRDYTNWNGASAKVKGLAVRRARLVAVLVRREIAK